MNQLGQIVFKKRLSQNQSIFDLEWSGLPKGIYFYSIEKGSVAGKLIIE